MCVCVCVCVCVHLGLLVYICMSVMHVSVFMDVFTRGFACVLSRSCVCSSVRECICICSIFVCPCYTIMFVSVISNFSL